MPVKIYVRGVHQNTKVPLAKWIDIFLEKFPVSRCLQIQYKHLQFLTSVFNEIITFIKIESLNHDFDVDSILGKNMISNSNLTTPLDTDNKTQSTYTW